MHGHMWMPGTIVSKDSPVSFRVQLHDRHTVRYHIDHNLKGKIQIWGYEDYIDVLQKEGYNLTIGLKSRYHYVNINEKSQYLGFKWKEYVILYIYELCS